MSGGIEAKEREDNMGTSGNICAMVLPWHLFCQIFIGNVNKHTHRHTRTYTHIHWPYRDTYTYYTIRVDAVHLFHLTDKHTSVHAHAYIHRECLVSAVSCRLMPLHNSRRGACLLHIKCDSVIDVINTQSFSPSLLCSTLSC